MNKVLFILKRREDYSAKHHSSIGLSTGLYNSAKFMSDMLTEAGVPSILEVAVDNNCIDRIITKHKPTHVVIEALWVVPQKFSVLRKLHPNVQWIVRLHSEMPFMASEGMAMDWLGDYARIKNLKIACNAPRMYKEISFYLGQDAVIYLPNFYPQSFQTKKFNKKKEYIDICCFGAVRPLKNHLLQAYAALMFADRIGKKLRFHINSGRIEMKGDPIVHNLKGMFQHLYREGHELVNNEWSPREDFLKVCANMDIGLQCNFSETFNIVSADLISQGVPIVGCSEIPWSVSLFNAIPTESIDIANAIHRTYFMPQVNVLSHQFKLKRYTDRTRKIWVEYFTQG